METKYRVLRILTWVYRAIAIVVFLVGGGVGAANAVSPPVDYLYDSTNPYPGIALAIASIIIALTLYAFGELLHLFIDVEENTRHTSRMLGRMQRKEKD